MKQFLTRSFVLACAFSAVPAVAQTELFEFTVASDGNAWDALLHEPSNSGNYFLNNQGPNSSNAFIMQPPGNQNLMIFRDTEGNGVSDGDPINIEAYLTVQDASGVDQDFSVNGFDWRNVWRTAEYGWSGLQGLKDGVVQWESVFGYNPEPNTPITEGTDLAAGQISNLSATIDEIRWWVPDYVDNSWNVTNIDNLEITIASTGGGINGDYNDSGLVEQGDLDQVLTNWGTSFDSVSASWINQRPTEGIVDQAELDVVLTAWGSSSAPDFTGSAVPEPASLALLGALAGLACATAGKL